VGNGRKKFRRTCRLVGLSADVTWLPKVEYLYGLDLFEGLDFVAHPLEGVLRDKKLSCTFNFLSCQVFPQISDMTYYCRYGNRGQTAEVQLRITCARTSGIVVGGG
jgi:hypothetical protein